MIAPGLLEGVVDSTASFNTDPINVSDITLVAGATGAGNTSAVAQFQSLTNGGDLHLIKSYILISDVDTPVSGEWHIDEPSPPSTPSYEYRMLQQITTEPFNPAQPTTWTSMSVDREIRVTALRFGPVGEVKQAVGIFEIRDASTLEIKSRFRCDLTADSTL